MPESRRRYGREAGVWITGARSAPRVRTLSLGGLVRWAADRCCPVCLLLCHLHLTDIQGAGRPLLSRRAVNMHVVRGVVRAATIARRPVRVMLYRLRKASLLVLLCCCAYPWIHNAWLFVSCYAGLTRTLSSNDMHRSEVSPPGCVVYTSFEHDTAF